MNTEPVEDKFRQINSVMSYTNAFERIMNKNEPDRDKRMNLTGSLKHKNRKSFTISRLLITQAETKINPLFRIKYRLKRQVNADSWTKNTIRVRFAKKLLKLG